jgi:hypothetical protein
VRVPVVARLRDGLNKNLGEILNVMKMRCGEKLCHCKVWQPCVEQLHTLSLGHSQSQRTEQVPDTARLCSACANQANLCGTNQTAFSAIVHVRFRLCVGNFFDRLTRSDLSSHMAIHPLDYVGLPTLVFPPT